MEFVRAALADVDSIDRLLYQVHDIHAKGRPDLFVDGSKKYTKDQIKDIINNPDSPVYVYKNDEGIVLAHAFIKYEYTKVKTMYIDDICVDEAFRHQGICTKILHFLEEIAKENKCYRITLNVYMFNKEAVECYKKFGMEEYSMHLEKIIK